MQHGTAITCRCYTLRTPFFAMPSDIPLSVSDRPALCLVPPPYQRNLQPGRYQQPISVIGHFDASDARAYLASCPILIPPRYQNSTCTRRHTAALLESKQGRIESAHPISELQTALASNRLSPSLRPATPRWAILDSNWSSSTGITQDMSRPSHRACAAHA